MIEVVIGLAGITLVAGIASTLAALLYAAKHGKTLERLEEYAKR